jgi:L-cysteine:1D-myo-inositol 2-amino-2-deoxy-alpha-D-glucopyranoside ligase
LYDHAADEVRPVTPGPVATMYVCGITPYDATHLGHAATYLAFDLVHRLWLDAGHEVHYVQNITDVDDPLLERAHRDGIDWRKLAGREIQLFREDMASLRVLPPRDYIGAVEAVPEITAAVQDLADRGVAYQVAPSDAAGAGGPHDHADWYFDLAAAPSFGYESRYDDSLMRRLSAERGGDPDRPGKRQALDPLLWRLERPGEPAWDAPFGRGRPGWHIECAVIAANRIGPTIDVQGGGSDLVFPHHECSAAHAEVMTGQRPFAGHYTHAAMIGLEGEKMSKSRGNLVFVSRLRQQGVDPMALRTALLAGHYRTDRDWSDALLTTAQARLAVWRAAAHRSGEESSEVVTSLRRVLAADLDTPTAMALLDSWAADPDLEGPPVAAAADALLGLDLLQD